MSQDSPPKMLKRSVDNMFKGSGIYTETDNNMVDTVLVDDYGIIGLSQKAV